TLVFIVFLKALVSQLSYKTCDESFKLWHSKVEAPPGRCRAVGEFSSIIRPNQPDLEIGLLRPSARHRLGSAPNEIAYLQDDNSIVFTFFGNLAGQSPHGDSEAIFRLAACPSSIYRHCEGASCEDFS
ncbi:hypothetical protein L249_4052, partial [Ophiocordyceps polyrhachis-furcata BCC 54312]